MDDRRGGGPLGRQLKAQNPNPAERQDDEQCRHDEQADEGRSQPKPTLRRTADLVNAGARCTVLPYPVLFPEVSMKVKTAALATAAALLCSTVPMGAHHSFAGEYDVNKPVEVTGVVSKVEWTNPHARFFVDAVGEDKTVTNWSLELASPNSLTREGWGRGTLKVGDVVTVTGYVAKSGKNMASTRSVTMSDGRALFGGTQGIQ
jgi:hypothetical protein